MTQYINQKNSLHTREMSDQIIPINQQKEKLNIKQENMIIKNIRQSHLNSQDKIHLPIVNQNYLTPINNPQPQLFMSQANKYQEKKQNIQNNNSQYDEKLQKTHRLPRPQTSQIKVLLKNSQVENDIYIMDKFDQQSQLQIIVEYLKKYYKKQQITLTYENLLLNPEKNLAEQISHRKDPTVIKFTISQETINNDNSTLAILRKQQPQLSSKNYNLIKNVDQSIRLKTEHCNSFFSSQNGDQCGKTYSTKTDGNEEDQFSEKKQNSCGETRNNKNFRTHKKSSFFFQCRQDSEKQHSSDSQKMNNQGQNCIHQSIKSFSRQTSFASLLDQQILNQNSTQKNQKKLQSSHRNISISTLQNQMPQQKSELHQEQLKQKYSQQLNQIYQNQNQNIFVKCQYCLYFCVVTKFHKQDYFCQQCDMFSVQVDPRKITVENSCKHILNYTDVIQEVQNALQNRQLAKCGFCKQEINYIIIKRIDLNKNYFNLRLELMAQLLKNKIIKNQTYQIAQCTQTDCQFFTIWNPNKPLLKQGFCHSCCKRTAFCMESPQNLLIKINCGHDISYQKLLGSASDAQIKNELAKCSICQIQIPLKLYEDLGNYGSQYIDYAYNYQLDKLKQQFQKMTEIVVSNCSTLSCTFFYVFQNKTICNSRGQIVFSQQYNLDNQKIISFCPNCNQQSISNQWNERTKIKRQANIQFVNS